MIRTFLRPPSGPADWVADGIRVLGVVSVVVALIGWTLVDAATFALVLLGLVLPRFLGVRPALDIAFGVTLLVAGWSAVLDVYVEVRWWDLPVHFALTGLVALMLYILLVRVGALADPAAERVPVWVVTMLTVSFGSAAAVLWEIAEWFGHTVIDETIYVGYTDSIGDLAIGAAGAVVAALTARYWVAESRFLGAPARANA